MIPISTIRIILGVLIFFKVLTYLPHRLKADKTNDELGRVKMEGTGIFYMLRISALVFLTSYITYLFYPDWISDFLFPTTKPLQILGFMMELTTLLLSNWIIGGLGKNLTDTVETRQEHTLVVTGVYQYIQHPLYTSAFLSVLGLSLMTGNGLMLVSGTMLLMGIYLRTPTEEKILAERFGQAYSVYTQKTGRFFPKF